MKNQNNSNEKEFNPMLQFDAFTGGVDDGGLRSKDSIKMIICYLLANVSNVSEENVISTLVGGNIANYFEVTDTISWLINKGNVIKDENSFLTLTTECADAIEWVEDYLPYTIKKKSIELCRKLIAKDIFTKENKVEIIEKDGGYLVSMHISDKDHDFMMLNLFVSSVSQAEVIRDSFLNNPIKVYENLINSIFEEEE